MAAVLQPLVQWVGHSSALALLLFLLLFLLLLFLLLLLMILFPLLLLLTLMLLLLALSLPLLLSKLLSLVLLLRAKVHHTCIIARSTRHRRCCAVRLKLQQGAWLPNP